MPRAFYSDDLAEFLSKSKERIFGEIMISDESDAGELQKKTWLAEIDILKRELAQFCEGHVIFEYTIPRIGRRIDNVLIFKGILFLIEFKVGETAYPHHALDQVIDYALDLKNFHNVSHDKFIVPILCCTHAADRAVNIDYLEDNILDPICCNENGIYNAVKVVSDLYSFEEIKPEEWINSIYKPTPTIIEAAQALYRGHDVKDITRKDAGAINLSNTTDEINRIIDDCKANRKKAICFVTGVPGAGKTLVGLNLSIDRRSIDENEHAVYLSGNGPLVEVLQEALARDDNKRNGITKNDAMRKAKKFIQNIYNFRAAAIENILPPIEKVAIFDEAQRAWTENMLTKFMKEKKGIHNFGMSEPEFLISIMDRHEDWAVIVCLIGGGQEINTGEAGLSEWFQTLQHKFPKWDIFISSKITDTEYLATGQLENILAGRSYNQIDDLHLSVSLRSFRSEKVSAFVKALLDVDLENARNLLNNFKHDYPIVMTRDLDKAKKWIRRQAKGSERYGITASSSARRLRTFGIWVQNKIDAKNWFLGDKKDVRSSYYLEETATEFDIQGLELDWSIICWDADLRFAENEFEHFSFKGTKWQRVNKLEKIGYLKNAYRVLLTRARQGVVIYIPTGDNIDHTRNHKFYDGTYNYLRQIGIDEL